jgi:hypothetical protein
VSELEAGRELDALVAEKVMGWQRLGEDDYSKPGHPLGLLSDFDQKGPHPRIQSPESGAFYFCPCQDGRYQRPDAIEPPFYSTDIAAAWQVVERIKELEGCGLFVTWANAEYGDPSHWEVGFVEAGDEGYGHEQRIVATADTAPLAICGAALAAVAAQTTPSR